MGVEESQIDIIQPPMKLAPCNYYLYIVHIYILLGRWVLYVQVKVHNMLKVASLGFLSSLRAFLQCCINMYKYVVFFVNMAVNDAFLFNCLLLNYPT